MGIAFADVTTEFLWTYLPEFNIYVSPACDTNFASFTCTGGKQIGDDLFVLDFKPKDDYYSDCILTLRKVDGVYWFVSNLFVE